MINGKNLNIRPIAERDLDELILKLGDIESLGDFLPLALVSESNCKREYSENGFIRESGERYVITSESDSLIGSIWMFRSIPYFDSFELGYHIFENEFRGKGYATESVSLLSDFVFKSRQVNRLEIRMASDDEVSEKVALRSGFTHEGTSREAAFSNGKHHDMHTYSLLRREWSANKSKHADL